MAGDRAPDEHRRGRRPHAAPSGRQGGVLVEGGEGSVADPYVSFDGKGCTTRIFTSANSAQARTSTRSTSSRRRSCGSPFRSSRRTRVRAVHEVPAATGEPADRWGVFNLGPCPLPGGRVAFVSNRNAFKAPRGYPAPCPPALRDGRRRRQRRVHRPPQPRHGPAPGDPQGRPDHVQLAGVAGRARQSSLWGSGPSTPTAPTGARSSAPSTAPAAPTTASTSRRSSPTAASSPRSTTTRTTGLRHLLQAAAAAARTAYPAFGPAATRRPATNDTAAAGRLDMRGRGTFRMPFSPTGSKC